MATLAILLKDLPLWVSVWLRLLLALRGTQSQLPVLLLNYAPLLQACLLATMLTALLESQHALHLPTTVMALSALFVPRDSVMKGTNATLLKDLLLWECANKLQLVPLTLLLALSTKCASQSEDLNHVHQLPVPLEETNAKITQTTALNQHLEQPKFAKLAPLEGNVLKVIPATLLLTPLLEVNANLLLNVPLLIHAH